MIRRLIRCGLGLAVVVAVASPAAAQTGKSSAVNQGLMLRGLGGVTFTGVTGAIFSGAFGAGIGRNVVVFGEIGRMTNVTPGSIQDLVDQVLHDELSDVTVDLKLKVPATFYLAGVRFVITTKGSVQPFIEGGGGLAHVTASATLKVDGEDLTQEFRDFLDQSNLSLSANQLLLMFGGGITCRLTAHTSIDAGYRLMFVATEDPSIKANTVYAAITWRR
jgi:opacity protein-like surface antigen